MTLSAEAVAKLYQNIDFAKSSEPRSARMIDNALTICRRLLAVSSIKALLMAIEERYPCGSPLNSVFKLQEIIDRGGGNKDVIFWILSKIDDELRTGVLCALDVSCRNLKRNTPKSITDIICAKQAMKNYLLTTVLDSKNIRQDCKAKIREMLQSVETYRSLYRFFCEHLDTPTLADWPDSGKKMILFIESCVYLSAYETDHAIRSHLKAGRQAEEILSYAPHSQIGRLPLMIN